MRSAPFWRTADKVGFMVGSLIITSYCYMIGKFPHDAFYVYYEFVLIALLISRLLHYYSYGWHYFIIDFCYFANAIILCVLIFESQNDQLLKVGMLFANGALGAAIPIFRNSLVFHKIDMLTSLAIHLMPLTCMFHIKWVTL